MGKSPDPQIVGYRYSMSLQSGIGRGPIDELIEIRVADQTAWSGSQTDTGSFTINAPELFGGDKKEGGIQGLFRLFMGKADQVYPDDIKDFLAGGAGAVDSDWDDYLTRYPDVQAAYDALPAPALVMYPTREEYAAFSYETYGQFEGRTLTGATAFAPIPDHRGVVTSFFDGLICSVNPYPKEWKFRLRRAVKGWYQNNCWYPEAAVISMASGAVKAMNPAHIVFQCATDPDWGRGLPWELIDQAAFRLCADRLKTEGFGLCMPWARQNDLDEFVQSVIDHIGGAIFVDRETGLFTMRLIRNDYFVDNVPLYDVTNGLLSLDDNDASSSDQSYNEVVIQYHDPITNLDGQVRAQNLASFQANGSFVSQTKSFPGIPTTDLAARVGLREINVSASQLKRFKVRLDRRGWRIAPASPFRVQTQTGEVFVLRAVTIDDGTMKDGTITVTALQDVFGLPATSYLVVQPPTWAPPVRAPQLIPASRFVEVTYRDLVRKLSRADLNAVTADESFVAALAARAGQLALNFELQTAAPGETLADRALGTFSPFCILAADIGPYDTAITILVPTADVDPLYDGAVMIDDELCRVDAIDTVALTMTLARGCVDTIPQPHAATARIWFKDTGGAADNREYAAAEIISAKVLSITNSGRLDDSLAPLMTLTTAARQGRPYPPGLVKLNTVLLFNVGTTIESGDLVFTWADRDRITQADVLIDTTEASVGPEIGVTYTLRFYDGLTLLSTHAAIAADTFTYDATMSTADGDVGLLTCELVSVRDGIESLQPWRIVVRRSDGGYGLGYGEEYGGL